ncbi:MAG TPA: glycosyltransferase [Gemmatimonadaceae bacterium]|nr:glycosyltransferase [Gemmatimonadaceae bacterium]
MSELDISIVIPTRARAEILRDTLGALARQHCDPARMEVIVVMDGACADTRAMVETLRARFPSSLTLLEQPRAGQGAARNRGMTAARADIVLLLDDDILAEPQLVREHTRHHVAGKDMIVTGNLPVEDVAGAGAHHRATRDWWAGELRARALPDHRFTLRDFVTGNVSFPRARLLALGGFDPMFSGYGREDYEAGYRLLRAGLPMVHEPRAAGLHRYRKAPLEWLRQTYSQGRADVLFARKHPEIVQDVMGLSPFPAVSWIARSIAAQERRVLALNAEGGPQWQRAAGIVQAAHYWRGVRSEAHGRRELSWLIRAQHAALRAAGRDLGARRRFLAALLLVTARKRASVSERHAAANTDRAAPAAAGGAAATTEPRP